MFQTDVPLEGTAHANGHYAHSKSGRQAETVHFAIALLPGYSILSLTSFIETLSLANRLAAKRFLSWATCSANGAAVLSSAGLGMEVDRSIADLHSADFVLMCSGPHGKDGPATAVMRWLRKSVRHGAKVGSLDCGSEVLAEAGLLDGKCTAIHWQRYDSFQERFPDIQLSRSAFVFAENTFSSSGGTSAIDLALSFIETIAGPPLAQDVADELCYSQQRQLHALTVDTSPLVAQLAHPKMRRVLREMNDKMEEAPSIEYFADLVGISQRQLERLFVRHLGLPPKRFFNDMRLDRARNLLMQTDMSVTEICVATGFSGVGFFSRKFCARFGVTPHQARYMGFRHKTVLDCAIGGG